ncbi:hypothetical protein DHW03_05795 [Pedobacter yonginense]|uniref:Amidohydrolase 3 domain-containing protein n=1 Tax=Pedobacter yonginense TaxID=651869 RepID=A0A317ETE4_9SPHI|nr:amidohydrolase [Pedobacter yonginense]PWS29327.1 hypothetical protein DHW03_05795 [Pedobacter yonginense]
MQTLYFNGSIFTNSQPEWINNFVVENTNISEINIENIDFSNYDQVVDLNGKFVFPGFCDEHIHIWKVGNLLTYMLDVRGVQSIKEMLSKIQNFITENPNNQWYIVRGFNEVSFEDKRLPTAEDLNQLQTEKPVFVIRSCAHIGIANTKAMEVAGIFKQNNIVPSGGEMRLNSEGKPNGIFTETALGLITNHFPKYTYNEYKSMILKAQDLLLSYGITAATDPAVHPELLEAYHKMNQEGLLKIRINAIAIRLPDGQNEALPLPQKFKSDFLIVDTVKFFSDGGLSGKTAAMTKPYRNSDYCGVLRLDFETFYPLAKESIDAGFKIATHAIGDKAVNICLDVYEAIQGENKVPNRIEHLGFLSEKNAEQMKKLGTVAVMQPVFINELGENFIDALDQDRLNFIYPIKKVIDHAIPLAFSTDGPVVKQLDPFVGINSACNRISSKNNNIGKDQEIDRKSAVTAYFSNEILNRNFKNSKIEPGYHADFNIFETNIFHQDSKLTQTCINGKPNNY